MHGEDKRLANVAITLKIQTQVSAEKIREYTELFNRIDKQKHGKITAEDAKGFTTDTELFMDLADTNKDGWIYRNGFKISRELLKSVKFI